MRISDCSSDVCSSDLPLPVPVLPRPLPRLLGVFAIARMLHGHPSRPGVQGVDKPRLAPQHTRPAPARVAELVDALASGASGGNSVEVRVLSRAPGCRKPPLAGVFSGYARRLPGRTAMAGRRLG